MNSDELTAIIYQPRNDHEPGYIYLMEAENYHGLIPGAWLRRCKIGLSRNPEARLDRFHRNQPPCNVKILRIIYVEDMAEVESQTLLPAELVCFALQWLGLKGKRFPQTEDPERVNRRFSKTLNEACKQWEIFPSDERTYHKFRAAYLRAAIVNDGNVDPYDFTDFAKAVLGDDDENTINAYKRYEIKAGSITRI